jgi:hypothetical protein
MEAEVVMELRKNWFPLVLAATWMVLCAAVLLDFAKFNATTGGDAVAVTKAHPGAKLSAAGRRAPRAAAALR